MTIKRGTSVMFVAASHTGRDLWEDPNFESERDKQAQHYFNKYDIRIGDIGKACGGFRGGWVRVSFKTKNGTIIVPLRSEHFRQDFNKNLSDNLTSVSENSSESETDDLPKLETNEEWTAEWPTSQCDAFNKMKAAWQDEVNSVSKLEPNNKELLTTTSIKCAHAACLEAVRWAAIVKDKDVTIAILKNEIYKLKKVNATQRADQCQADMNVVVVESELEKLDVENMKLKEHIAENATERRYDSNNCAYTYKEFVDYYGVIDSLEIWVNSNAYPYPEQENYTNSDNSELTEVKTKLTHLEKVMSGNLVVVDGQQTILKEQVQVLQEQKKRLDMLHLQMIEKYNDNSNLCKNIETTMSNIHDDVFRVRDEQSERISSLEQKSEWVVPTIKTE